MTAATALARPPADNPPELGRVVWLLDYDAAANASKASGKPIFLLFQEVPGCQTCRDFGANPLSHPLLIEAIEDQFIPVAIHNNKPGKDAEILKRFDEPAWNNPVVRFIDAHGNDVIPRRDEILTTDGVANRMIDAMKAARREAPEYLKLVAAEAAGCGRGAHATFAMHCFWEGEAALGAIDGVVATRAAFLEGKEAVEVVFDPQTISRVKLEQQAAAMNCHAVSSDEPPKPAPNSDQKHALAHTGLNFLPLTPMQATKINAALHSNQEYRRWLSPRQIALARQIDTALERDPKALQALARPDSIDQLVQYTDQLRVRLAAAGATD